ncbi:M20 family metallopeptidase [Clostridium boliviensis]|uniref:Peptidase M20 domain-containing protein 2 n=1 Tax=Clostridium boliviensis TaxID=318465 RepID=A0ABU4GQN8_9CLOT|nr:M20 family metallopeptidase [Clostridium boliviensis]MDW2799944.1 M20 family metallopeptidase [Clostridium boliviensis]
MEINKIKAMAKQAIEEKTDKLWELALFLWNNPEYNFNEYVSSKAVSGLLETFGFEVERGICGLDTAFCGRYDSGKPGPNIGFLAEYDAVPGMGHSCGHNLMAAMAAGAGAGVKSVIDQLGGAITVYGTPAEEGGGGKVIMLERGAFKELDAAMIIHSANETVVNDISYSVTDITVTYHGKKAHGATWPEEGVSALEPLLLLFQYMNGQRLSWNGRGTILGVITDGGREPITIPEFSQAKFTVRSFDQKFKEKILKEFLEAGESIASMTRTTFQYEQAGHTYEDIRNNPGLEALLEKNFTELGETVMPRRKELGIGCTDVGNITHVIPALQSYVKVVPEFRGHTREFEEACRSAEGKKAVLTGAKALCLTALDLLASPEEMEKVKRSFEERRECFE